MNIERPGSPSATTVAPTSKRRSTSIETKRSRLASERPPKKGVAIKNAFRSGELTAIDLIYSRSQRRQAGQARRIADISAGSSRRTGLIAALKKLRAGVGANSVREAVIGPGAGRLHGQVTGWVGGLRHAPSSASAVFHALLPCG